MLKTYKTSQLYTKLYGRGVGEGEAPPIAQSADESRRRLTTVTVI